MKSTEKLDGGPGDDRTWLIPFRESWVITGFTITWSVDNDPDTHEQWVRRIHPGDRYPKTVRQRFGKWRQHRKFAREDRKRLRRAVPPDVPVVQDAHK